MCFPVTVISIFCILMCVTNFKNRAKINTLIGFLSSRTSVCWTQGNQLSTQQRWRGSWTRQTTSFACSSMTCRYSRMGATLRLNRCTAGECCLYAEFKWTFKIESWKARALSTNCCLSVLVCVCLCFYFSLIEFTASMSAWWICALTTIFVWSLPWLLPRSHLPRASSRPP